MRLAAVVAAAGTGRRMKLETPKPFLRIGGLPLFILSLKNLMLACAPEELVLVFERSQIAGAERLLARYNLRKVRVVPGGRTRAESVLRGLQSVARSMRWVLVHDAARPFVSRELVRCLLKTLEASPRVAGVVPILPATSTVKLWDSQTCFIRGALDRNKVVLVQTPQVFQKALLLRRYDQLGREAFQKTDEASFFDGTRYRVKAVRGDAQNFKITTAMDFELAKLLIRAKRD